MVKMESLAGVLSILLLLCLTNLCVGDTSRETVEVFKDGHTNVENTGSPTHSPDGELPSFSAPAFVGGLVNDKEFLAIFSTAKWSATNARDKELVARTRYGNQKEWSNARAFTKLSDLSAPYGLWGDVTAVMKKNTIYVLATTWNTTQEVDLESKGNIMRYPLMISGDVTSTPLSFDNENVFINWRTVMSLKDKLPPTVHGTKGSHFVGGIGNGIVTTNGSIMFPIIMQKDTEMIASTLYSIDDGHTWNIGGATEEGTTSGSVVEGNDGKILFAAASSSGYRKVFESDDFGITWKKSPIFYGVWGNNPSRSGYKPQGSAISVPMDGKNVFFFSHPLNKNNNDYLDNLQLWLSDGQRIVCVGTISETEKELNTGKSILVYVGEHLYITHQINPYGVVLYTGTSSQKTWSDVIGLTPLRDFFAKSQSTVSDWRHLDDIYRNMGINTNGLVGVLGDAKAKGVWADVYNCVNATVTGGEILSGGFCFDGKAGSGAKWPVQSQGQNQLYKFTENAFTLTANITIHSKSESGDISLIGASSSSDGRTVMIGLGYKKQENKWYVMQKTGENINTEIPVELDKEYKVAITFADGQGAVYVDGVNIAKQSIQVTNPMAIDHFFIGGNGLSSQSANGHSCTIKNVMLFSRALQQSEIDPLKDIKGSSEVEKAILTANKRIEEEIKEPASTVKLQSAREAQGLTSNAQSTSKQGVRNTVLQNHIASASKTGKSGSNRKSTFSSKDHQSVSNTPLTRTGEKQKTNANNKEVSASTKTQTDLQAMVTTAPTSQETLSKKKHHEEAGIVQQSVTTAKDNDNQILNSLQKYSAAGVQTKIAGDKSAIVSLASVFWISIFCALISMTLF